jgi:small multidrug resistance pump
MGDRHPPSSTADLYTQSLLIRSAPSSLLCQPTKRAPSSLLSRDEQQRPKQPDLAAPALMRGLNKLRGGNSEVSATMRPQLAWMVLFSATGFELVSTFYMHQARGFSRPVPSALAVIFYGASFYLFNLSLRGLELSVAYAVWSAVVMALLALIGITALGESVNLAKVTGILSIIFGTVCLSTQMNE